LKYQIILVIGSNRKAIPKTVKTMDKMLNLLRKIKSKSISPAGDKNKVASSALRARIVIFPDIPVLSTDLLKKLYLSTQKYKTSPIRIRKDPRGIS